MKKVIQPPKYQLKPNLQHTVSASRRWNARKTFFVGKFSLKEVFFVGKLGLASIEKLSFAAPLEWINFFGLSNSKSTFVYVLR